MVIKGEIGVGWIVVCSIYLVDAGKVEVRAGSYGTTGGASLRRRTSDVGRRSGKHRRDEIWREEL